METIEQRLERLEARVEELEQRLGPSGQSGELRNRIDAREVFEREYRKRKAALEDWSD